MTKLIRFSAAFLVLPILYGCATASAPPSATPRPEGGGMMMADAGMMGEGMMGKAMMGKAMMASCPMHVPGTVVGASDVDGGAALTFTTESGDVADLRRRVHEVADMHNDGCSMMAKHDHGTAGSDAAGHESQTGK